MLESSPIHFSEEVVAYEDIISRHAWLLNKPFVDMLCRLGLRRGNVLDIGTGPGWIPIELARRNPDWTIWALDTSADMLAQARWHAKAAGVAGQIHFIEGAAAHLPFEAGKFDLVFSHYILHHLERPEEALNEAARVTGGGGKILMKDLLRRRWR